MAAFSDITREDMEQRFGAEEVAELDMRAGGLETAIDQALTDAKTKVAAMIGGRFNMRKAPAATASSLHQPIADIARYLAYDDAVPEAVQNRYENAIAYLRDLAKFKAEISDPDVDVLAAWDAIDATRGTTSRATVAYRRPGPRIFTRRTLQDYGNY